MRNFRFKFETVQDGKTRGIVIEGPSFSLALEQASTQLNVGVSDLLLLKQERQEGDLWVVTFDPFQGIY